MMNQSEVGPMLIFDSISDYQVNGKKVFIVGNPTKCDDFSHITGQPVEINGANYTAIAVESFAHSPPWRVGEKIGIQVEATS